MAQLFDEVTRIVGSRMPRRQALRLICRGLAGSALVALGLRAEPGTAASPSPEPLGQCYKYLNCVGITGGQVSYEDCCGGPDDPCVNKSWKQMGTNTCTRCAQCPTSPSPTRPSFLRNG